MMFGKNWEKITDHVGTRNVNQVRGKGDKIKGRIKKYPNIHTVALL